MSTRTAAVSPLHGFTSPTRIVTAPTTVPRVKLGQQELWAGAVYLMVWTVLWLAVIVTVLAPLDGLLGGAR
jgi:hypothetical protein